MAVAVVYGLLTYHAQKAQFDVIAARSGPGVPVQIGSMMGGVGLVFAITWGFALPVFMLIWLNLRAAREHVRSWRAPVLGA